MRAAFLLAMGLFAMGPPAVGHAGCLDDIRHAGVMRVGNGLLGAHPSLWQDRDGAYHGIDADLLSELTRRMGLPRSEFVITEWSTIIPGLKAGRWDVVLSDVNITQEREVMGHVRFSMPYFMLYDYVIVPDDSPIHSLADLKGRTIGSVLGTNDSATAHRLVARGIGASVADYDTFGDPFLALRNRQIDAVVVDQPRCIPSRRILPACARWASRFSMCPSRNGPPPRPPPPTGWAARGWWCGPPALICWPPSTTP
ncbi:substrate-binding periplasmic protein [Komagataeibacter kakiaceti]|uniref:substrate-binding periplasmic protein n=1 Tax=Komagataeibacter kakiaceti TaxID=943261 RepID=UPI0006864823|nr:ABC transporter substrate-binding protein [Komagataeibacter kakiaceti]